MKSNNTAFIRECACSGSEPAGGGTVAEPRSQYFYE